MSKKHKNKDAKNGQELPHYRLQTYHYRAIELRYEGNTYQQIGGFIAVEYHLFRTESAIRKWFGRNGLCEKEYDDYATKENARRRNLMQHELKKLVGKIPQKIERLLDRLDDTGQPDMVVVQTLKLLAMLLSLVPKEMDSDGSIDKVEEYVRSLQAIPSKHESP